MAQADFPTAQPGFVRPARAGDAPRIAELIVFAKRTAYRDIFRDDDGSFNLLRVDRVAEELTGPGALDGVLVFAGVTVMGMLRREYGAGEACSSELCELYVDPFFAGRGVGSALTGFFLREAAEMGAESVGLWVIKANLSARRFYEARGFAPTGERRPVAGTAVEEVRYYKLIQQ